MNHPTIHKDSAAWIMFVWISFIISIAMGVYGIYRAPVDGWVRGYLAIAFLFAIGSAFSLAKTLRDNSEADKMINRVVDARTEQILSEYELRRAAA